MTEYGVLATAQRRPKQIVVNGVRICLERHWEEFVIDYAQAKRTPPRSMKLTP